MKTPLSENRHSTFTDVAKEVFQSTLNSMFDKDIKVSFSEVSSGGPDDLAGGYEGQVLIIVTEEKSGLEAGLMFKTADITFLTNLMMMMDEPGKESLEDDDKDAIKELASQALAAVTVPLEEKTQVKVSFRIDDVMVNDAPALFQSDAYMIIDADLGIGDQNTTFRFYTDINLMNLFGGGDDEEPDFGSAFTFPEDDDEPATGGFGGGYGGGSPSNLDLLLDIDVPVSVKMGSTKMFLKDILTMGSGNIIELDESADEPVELVINNKVIARGEVVIVDGYFGFRIKEIVSRAERIKKLKD
ncbi:flagellar motor switch protein FliN [Denitrovibrio acetiphilus DSM 12809]|uniref:Flagellar motor switch protein FliN n=1 Tax=Denitrovibrio acetiphilus (strain DSM 12809 / NBRC 114555 / N2460) TaxID=522772 RepID=D4H6C7_DENA2|nr:flagellar motor switch protein FliN [Denitrovibrio acetiphilus]ADD69601.1 flagellar motor switch protein FliN [Denitrovibrio acetiphilus DSM 12809]